MRSVIVAPLLMLVLGGCVSTRVNIDYSTRKYYSSQIGGNQEYREITPIQASASGFVWNSCQDLIADITKQLDSQVASSGGNGLVQLKWRDRDIYVIQPTCVTGYGWFLLWIVGGLGPWVKQAYAEGIVVSIAEGQ